MQNSSQNDLMILQHISLSRIGINIGLEMKIYE